MAAVAALRDEGYAVYGMETSSRSRVGRPGQSEDGRAVRRWAGRPMRRVPHHAQRGCHVRACSASRARLQRVLQRAPHRCSMGGRVRTAACSASRTARYYGDLVAQPGGPDTLTPNGPKPLPLTGLSPNP